MRTSGLRSALALGALAAALGGCNYSSPAPAVSHLTVSPSAGTVAVGATLQFSAATTDADGNNVPGAAITRRKVPNTFRGR